MTAHEQSRRNVLLLAALCFLRVTKGSAVAQSSPDGGWTTSGPPGANVAALAADPTNGLRVFAGTELGVFRTDDGGAQWTSLPTGPRTSIFALALDPSSDTRLWAGTNDGVFESTDGGASFVLRQGPSTVRALAIDPTDPSTIYAAGDGPHVFKSTDGGATWSNGAMSWPNRLTSELVQRISQLVIDPDNRSHVLAAVEASDVFYPDYPPSQQVIGSFDAGRTWLALPEQPGSFSGPAATLAFDPRGNGVLYAAQGGQVSRSSNGGVTWQVSPFQSLGYAVTSLVVDPRHAGTLYAGSDQGAFRSTDSGGHWELLPGPPGFSVNALAFDADRGVLHAATTSGVWEYAVQPPTPSPPCQEDSGSMCLLGGRFSARIDAWNPSTGTHTSGTAVSETDGFGYFSLPALTGDSSLPEVLVKMVDAAAPPWNSDWVLWGSVTGVPFLLTVTDTTTGQARTYENDPNDPFCGGADTQAFPSATGGAVSSTSTTHLEATGDALSLLHGQIQVQITASDPWTGASIAGTAIARGDRFGYFSFPSLTGDPALPEVFVKAIDATALSGTFWFFYSGMTSVPYTLTVHNTNTGETISNLTTSGPFCGGADLGISPGRQ